ncbi:MAG TPA: YceI family protein [Thermoanaerobaculia bacterium]|nr:YceI family protein [Thermoanaerobaculia bacterium]
MAKDGTTLDVTGNLTLHGVTRSITFPVSLPVLGDEVKITIEVEANRQAKK